MALKNILSPQSLRTVSHSPAHLTTSVQLPFRSGTEEVDPEVHISLQLPLAPTPQEIRDVETRMGRLALLEDIRWDRWEWSPTVPGEPPGILVIAQGSVCAQGDGPSALRNCLTRLCVLHGRQEHPLVYGAAFAPRDLLHVHAVSGSRRSRSVSGNTKLQGVWLVTKPTQGFGAGRLLLSRTE